MNKLTLPDDCCVYWINLESRVDRRRRMEARLAQAGWLERSKRIEAVGPDEITEFCRCDSASLKNTVKRAIACTLSHMKALETAGADQCNCAIILEDDVTFDTVSHWKCDLQSILSRARFEYPHFDSLNLSWFSVASRVRVKIEEWNQNEQKLFIPHFPGVFGAFSYVVSQSGLKRIVERFYNDKKTKSDIFSASDSSQMLCYPFDVFLHLCSNSIVCTIPLLAYEALDSQIHDSHLKMHMRHLRYIQKAVASDYFYWPTSSGQLKRVSLSSKVFERKVSIGPDSAPALKVNAMWWCKCGPNKNNVGDTVGPYLYHKITGRRCRRVGNPSRRDGKKFFLTCGSILQCNNLHPDRTIVWGSGVICDMQPFGGQAHLVTATRGPLTRRWLQKCNISCPEVYGDPALLLPLFYKPRSVPNNKSDRKKVGIIPHYTEYEVVNHLFSGCEWAQVIDMCESVEQVCDSISSCRFTLSSSLHGIIISHAYEIESAWVKCSKKMRGDGTKFLDYYLSLQTQIKKIEPLQPLPEFYQLLEDNRAEIGKWKCLMNSFFQPDSTNLNNIQVRLLEACPFRCQFQFGPEKEAKKFSLMLLESDQNQSVPPKIDTMTK